MIERVHFTKPLFRQLNAEGYSCIDMHYHTQYSDTYTRVGNILKKCRKKGVGVAITDHNAIKGCIEMQKKNKGNEVMFIPGIEASCLEGTHLLIYFYDMGGLKDFYNGVIRKSLSKNPHLTTLRFDELVSQAERYSCLMSAAHPFNVLPWNLQRKIEKGRIDESLLSKIHSFEVINGLMGRKMNLKAVEWAREHNKCITAGSDGHTLKILGHAVTCSKADNAGDFLDSIRKNRNIVMGTEIKAGFRAVSNFKVISKQSKYAGCSLKFHYQHRLKGKIKPKVMEKLGKVKERFI